MRPFRSLPLLAITAAVLAGCSVSIGTSGAAIRADSPQAETLTEAPAMTDLTASIRPIDRNQRDGTSKREFQVDGKGTCPASVYRVDTGRILSATTETGESLILDDAFFQRVSPFIFKVGTPLVFHLGLKAPATNSKQIATLTGFLLCDTASSVSEIDLGFSSFRKNARGTALGARIEELKPDPQEPGTLSTYISMTIDSFTVASCQVLDHQGKTLPNRIVSQGSVLGQHGIGLQITGKAEDLGRIVFTVRQGVQRQKLPFALHDIAIPGGQ